MDDKIIMVTTMVTIMLTTMVTTMVTITTTMVVLKMEIVIMDTINSTELTTRY